MKQIILNEPIEDKHGNTFIPRKFGEYPIHQYDISKRKISATIAEKYLFSVEKRNPPCLKKSLAGWHIGFPTDYSMIIYNNYTYLWDSDKAIFQPIDHQSISSRIYDNSELYLFYNFWDLVSFFTLNPEQEEKMNFIVLNRHTKNDHNYKDALNLIIKSHFSKIYNFVKIPIHKELAKDKAIAETKRIQYELECYCEVFPRWKEFEEESLNNYLITLKKTAPK